MAHISQRVDVEYPPGDFGGAEGAVPTQLRQDHGLCPEHGKGTSAFEMKQSTMPDTPNAEARLFHGMRPSIVVHEAATTETFSQETLLQAAAPKIAGQDVKMSNEFQDQFISQYTARVFPWALNYDCGGADYPDLFADWQFWEKTLGQEASVHLKQRWRRSGCERFGSIVSGCDVQRFRPASFHSVLLLLDSHRTSHSLSVRSERVAGGGD